MFLDVDRRYVEVLVYYHCVLNKDKPYQVEVVIEFDKIATKLLEESEVVQVSNVDT